MPNFKVIASMEMTIEAEDLEQAEAEAIDYLCWSNMDIEVLEETDDA